MSDGAKGAEPEQLPAPDDGRPPTVAIVVAVVAVVALLGFGAWLLARGDDVDGPGAVTTSAAGETTTTDGTTTTAPRTTERTTTTEASSTTSTTVPFGVPPSSGPPVFVPPPLLPDTTTPVTFDFLPETTDSTTVDTTAAPTTVVAPDGGLEGLVPNVAAEALAITADASRQQVIDRLLAAPRHDVASAQRVEMLCATVAVDRATRLGGRWEVDGRPLASSDLAVMGPPGFGECVDADGDPLEPGAYQFVAVDASGASSGVGTFVVGADAIAQQFRNNGRQDVCAVLVGPATARFYETYRLGDVPIEPGGVLTIPVGAVTQDVRTIGCDGDDQLAEFTFDPSDRDVQALVP